MPHSDWRYRFHNISVLKIAGQMLSHITILKISNAGIASLFISLILLQID